jgi:thioredoxin 1
MGPRPGGEPRNPRPRTIQEVEHPLPPGLGVRKTEEIMAAPLAITDATFQKEVLDSALPVVVDFWAPWCGPCQYIGPVVEKLAGELEGQVRFVKVNVDENQSYAAKYGVQGIPTLLLVRGGNVVDRIVGALPEDLLRRRITSTFGASANAH